MSVYVSELARWLGLGGHCIDIFTFVPATPQIVDLHPNVRLIHLQGGHRPEPAKEDLPRLLDEAFHRLERFRTRSGDAYDLIHSHYWLSAVVGAMAREHWQAPHLVTFHTLGAVKNDNAAVDIEPSGRVFQERQLVKAADRIIVPTVGEMAHLCNHYDAPRDKLSIIACGVNLERFQLRDRIAARQALGLDQRKEVVLYVGRFAPLKGVGVLLEAAASVCKERPDLQLVLVGGDGPAAGRDRHLMDRVHSMGIEDRVVFAGRRRPDQLAAYYAAADILALPSRYESFGLVVLESLACGTPVLATPVGIAPEVIIEGLNGTIVEGPEAVSVARGLRRLLDRPKDSSPAPMQIRDTVAGYGWDRTAAAMAACYGDALAAFAI